MPHGHCYLWKPSLVVLHFVSDLLIALAYASIPVTLVYFVRKRKDLPFDWMFLAFGTFIVACGATHIMEIWTLYTPVYWLSGVLKALTALASVTTAVALVRLLPRAISLPSRAELEQAYKESERAQEALKQSNEQMETRVQRRTAELEEANARLQREVDERERIQQERETLLLREQESRAQTEAASRLKDEFLATVSHELRTPLSAILGWAYMLRADKLTQSDKGRAIDIIEHNAKTQAQLINDMLDVSRIITGKLRLDMKPTDLTELVEETVETMSPTANAKGVSLRLVPDSWVALIWGDATRLQQVVWNLLSNAIKFTPKGGRVQVRLSSSREGLAEVIVSDTGQGIIAEFMPHLFERFRQADASTTRRHGGLGLGLAIVRHLVELHGGSVRAESAGQDQGTTFTIALPLAAGAEGRKVQRAKLPPAAAAESAAAASAAPQADKKLARLDGLRVLLVEDEPDTRDMLAAVLQRAGAAVRAAASVAEALILLEEQLPDVLLSDIALPGEDGYSLIRKLRSRPPERGGKLPAVALTAYAKPEDRGKALSAGYQWHIPKPIEPVELTAVVASLTGRAGPFDFLHSTEK
jgi:signal transduction histidine kinase/ActR/RegA family two-component response regulator